MFNLKKRVNAYLEEKKMTANRLARIIGIDSAVLYMWLRRGRKIREPHYEEILNWYLSETGTEFEQEDSNAAV
ncbi:MAG TPA: hypothetical protein PKX73_12130 [Anaerohalosphaeraceae bacterium]|nr:hypothetical protein [Anaerohalosphaeraceae bacterium]